MTRVMCPDSGYPNADGSTVVSEEVGTEECSEETAEVKSPLLRALLHVKWASLLQKAGKYDRAEERLGGCIYHHHHHHHHQHHPRHRHHFLDLPRHQHCHHPHHHHRHHRHHRHYHCQHRHRHRHIHRACVWDARSYIYVRYMLTEPMANL